MADQLEPIQERLAEIEDLYALDFGRDVDSKIGEASTLWNEAEIGSVSGDSLLSIRRASPLLSELYLKGIDIKRAYKFGPDELEVANWFGTHIDGASDLLHALRRERKSERDEGLWTINVPLTLALRDGLEYLGNKDILRGKRILIQSKEGNWGPFKWNWFRDDPESRLLVVYEKRNPKLAHLLTGHWLNAYVHSIIDNQLARHEVPYELYSEVVYNAPPDVIRAASDFDVIGRFRDTVICVECKSGRLDEKHGQVREVIQRTEDLRTVLSSMGTGETKFLFYLVYDAELNDGAQLAGQLADYEITPLRPTEVRPVIAKTLSAALR